MDKRSYRRLLLQLGMISVWRQTGGSNFVSKNPYQILYGENRRVIIRMIRRFTCISCSVQLPEDSTGDHIIPSALGGSDKLENFLPLCQPCNSSKGKRDLLVWWRWKKCSLKRMPTDVICAYARVMWTHLHDAGRVDEPAPDEAVSLVDEAIRALPYAKRAILSSIGGLKADLHSRPETNPPFPQCEKPGLKGPML